jgi:hypothetical protein
LVLRNSKAANANWFIRGVILAGLGLFLGVAFVVKEPGSGAAWFGLLLGLVVTCFFGTLAWLPGKKLLNRLPQLIIDQEGIHDLRPPPTEIRWSQVADIKGVSAVRIRGVLNDAHLDILMTGGQKETVDTLDLDQDHEKILDAAITIWRQALSVKNRDESR